MPNSNRIFDKRPYTIEEQIALLRERNLIINDEDEARHYLTFIGYYRLSGYMLHFQKSDQTDNHHCFYPDTKFKDILRIYNFDRKLRLHIMDAIERIEVAVKSVIINEMCNAYGTHWYMKPDHFSDRFQNVRNEQYQSGHTKLMHTIQADIDYHKPPDKIRNISIKHYRQKYDHPAMPPLWMVFETTSLGTISRLYSNLMRSDRRNIAANFQLTENVMTSWLHSCTIIRNFCAHHARIWNKTFPFPPKPLKAYKQEFESNTSFYAQALMLNILLHRVSPDTDWTKRLENIFNQYPEVPIAEMGFPHDWSTRDIWNSNENTS